MIIIVSKLRNDVTIKFHGGINNNKDYTIDADWDKLI